MTARINSIVILELAATNPQISLGRDLPIFQIRDIPEAVRGSFQFGDYHIYQAIHV
jgi:hypothetical protein